MARRLTYPVGAYIRAVKNDRGPLLFSPQEIHTLIAATTSTPLRAMILMGINCAFGQSDCTTLHTGALDLDGGWVEHPRPKTETWRRCKLWPETVEALRVAINERPEPTVEAMAERKIVFLTNAGRPWREPPGHCHISTYMRRLAAKMGLTQRLRGFYSLRRTFRTVADGTLDKRACDLIMGHESGDMGGTYVQRISDERLTAVADHVRAWLWPHLIDGRNETS